VAHRDDWAIGRRDDANEGGWNPLLQRFVGVDMQTTGNEPLCSIFVRAHIKNCYRPVLGQPFAQRLDIHLWHVRPYMWPLSTGLPCAFQSGTPPSTRNARYPPPRRNATASSAKRQYAPRQYATTSGRSGT